MVELILHELRTPLTVASGSIAQAADERAGALSPAQRAHLERARRACASLELVVRQLRDWTELVEATPGPETPMGPAITEAVQQAIARTGRGLEAPISIETDARVPIAPRPLAEALHAHLGDAHARPGQEPAEPGVLGCARRRHSHAHRGQVLDGAHGARMGAGDQQSHLGRRRQPKDEPGRLSRCRPQAEAQDCLERRRGEIRLALSEGFGSSGLSPRRPDGDGEPFGGEVALGLGDPDRKVLG